MKYETQEITERLQKARTAKGLSQRDLSALAGIPQAQISRIEAGVVDMRLSSLVALAHALDLELTLVPRKAVPAVKSLTRQATSPSAESVNAAMKEANRIGETLRLLQVKVPKLERIAQLQKSFADIQRLQLQFAKPEALKQLRRTIEQIQKPGKELEAIARSEKAMKALRNALAHGAPHIADGVDQKPAYTLDEDDDG